MTDESQKRLSPLHKNNRTLYLANAAYLNEAFIRAVVSGYNSNNAGNKGSSLIIQKINMQGRADEWIMITMAEHNMAKKLWKHLENRTVAEVATKYSLKVPTPPVKVVDSDDGEENQAEVADDPLIISWAMNREQRTARDRATEEEVEKVAWATPKNGKPSLPKATPKEPEKPVAVLVGRAVDAQAVQLDAPVKAPTKPVAAEVSMPVEPTTLFGKPYVFPHPSPIAWADEPIESLAAPIQKPQVLSYLPPMIQQQAQHPLGWYHLASLPQKPQPPMQQYQITTASHERGIIGTFYVPDDKYKAICAILFA